MRITQDLSMLLKGLKAEAAIAYDNTATFWQEGSKTYSYEVISYSDETGKVGTVYNDNPQYVVNIGSGSNKVLEQTIRSNWEVKLGYDRAWNNHQLSVSALYRQEMEESLGVNSSWYRPL